MLWTFCVRGLKMSIRESLVSCIVLFALSACAGTAPPEGYADGTRVVENGATFSTQSVGRIVHVDGEWSIKQQNFRLSIAEDGQTASLFLNDKTYELSYAAGDWDADLLFDADGAHLAGGYDLAEDVRILYFERDTNATSGIGYKNYGWFLAGYFTNPNQVSARTGTATYSGPAYATVVEGSSGDGDYANGTFNFLADFDTAEISGDIVLTDTHPGALLDFSTFRVGINGTASNPTEIVDGAFESELAETGTNTVIGMLNGSFYSENAASVGGTFWIDDAALGLLIQGAFASN